MCLRVVEKRRIKIKLEGFTAGITWWDASLREWWGCINEDWSGPWARGVRKEVSTRWRPPRFSPACCIVHRNTHTHRQSDTKTGGDRQTPQETENLNLKIREAVLFKNTGNHRAKVIKSRCTKQRILNLKTSTASKQRDSQRTGPEAGSRHPRTTPSFQNNRIFSCNDTTFW